MKLWKKVLAATAASACCLSFAQVSGFQNLLQTAEPVLSASAASGTYEDLTYSVNSSGEITITDCDKTVTAVEIPAEINGCPVTSIEDAAFRWCSNLTDITIPESITYIGKEAFSYTPWLKARQAENPLVIVNHIVIDGQTCTGDVVIPDGVTSIANYAFSSDLGLATACSTQMTSIIIPDSVTRIGSSAFAACTGLTGLCLPDSLTKIENWAFASCSNLTRITVPASVTSMGESIFRECSGLTIRGYADSTAQRYAEKYSIAFADLNNPDTLLGDVDNSGSIDSTDIYYALFHVANIAVGNDSGLEIQQIAAADIDCNGAVDSTDIYYLLYYVALHGAGLDKSWSEVLAK